MLFIYWHLKPVTWDVHKSQGCKIELNYRTVYVYTAFVSHHNQGNHLSANHTHGYIHTFREINNN